jgi:hypothetical protein
MMARPPNGEGRAPRQLPGPTPTTTATYGPATVTRLADWRQARDAGQWWGAHRMHTWDLAERSRWVS